MKEVIRLQKNCKGNLIVGEDNFNLDIFIENTNEYVLEYKGFLCYCTDKAFIECVWVLFTYQTYFVSNCTLYIKKDRSRTITIKSKRLII